MGTLRRSCRIFTKYGQLSRLHNGLVRICGQQTATQTTSRCLYQAIPEEFYQQSRLPVITPSNALSWAKHMKGYKLHLQERMSGSGRLSLRSSRLGLQVAFPVDYRYGWNVADPSHQGTLTTIRKLLGIKVTWWAPTCTPWSQASRGDSDKREAERPNIPRWHGFWKISVMDKLVENTQRSRIPIPAKYGASQFYNILLDSVFGSILVSNAPLDLRMNLANPLRNGRNMSVRLDFVE